MVVLLLTEISVCLRGDDGSTIVYSNLCVYGCGGGVTLELLNLEMSKCSFWVRSDLLCCQTWFVILCNALY